MEHFLAQGRRKLAEKYLDSKLVTFRFHGAVDADPAQAPLTAHHVMRDVVTALEDECFSFRPDFVFPFLRDALARFPTRLPREDAYPGPLLDEEYGRKVQRSIAMLVEHVVTERPEEPFEWLDEWLAIQAEREELEADLPPPTIEEQVADVSVWDMDAGQLSEFALELFMQHDADKSGGLDRKEFKAVLTSTALGFTSQEVREIMAESDANDDGIVDYKEFLPLMVELIGAMKAKAAAKAARDAAEDEKREAVEAYFVHGLSRDELDAVLRRVFQRFDADNSGYLDHKEFKKALKSADLGLTKKEINLLLSEVDFNDDGVVEYAEFVPICFGILVERAVNKQMENAAFSSHDGLTQLILSAFIARDRDESGVLQFSEIKAAMKVMAEEEELSLSRAQLVSVVSMCKIGPDGSVKYAAFAPVAAEVIYDMIDFDSQKRRAEAVTQLSSGDSNIDFMRDLTREQVEEVMMEAFVAADADGSGSLDREEMYGVLRAVGSEKLGLDDRQIAGIMAAADEDGDGTVDYGELTRLMFEILSQMAREDHVRDVAFMNADAEMKTKDEVKATVDDTAS